MRPCCRQENGFANSNPAKLDGEWVRNFWGRIQESKTGGEAERHPVPQKEERSDRPAEQANCEKNKMQPPVADIPFEFIARRRNLGRRQVPMKIIAANRTGKNKKIQGKGKLQAKKQSRLVYHQYSTNGYE